MIVKKFNQLNERQSFGSNSGFKYKSRYYEIENNVLYTGQDGNLEITIPNDILESIKDVHIDMMDYRHSKTEKFLDWVDTIDWYQIEEKNNLESDLQKYSDLFPTKEELISFITKYINEKL